MTWKQRTVAVVTAHLALALALPAAGWAAATEPPEYLRGGRGATPPRSGEVIRLLAGAEAVVSDAVGDQSGWIWHLPNYALQNPAASGKRVSVNISHTVLGRTVGLMFQAVSFGDDSAGNLDNTPNANFAIWRAQSGKTLNDPRDAGVLSWADIRRVTIGAATQPNGTGQVPFEFEFQAPQPTAGRGVFNFTFSDGVPAANLTLVRTGSSWWHYLFLGSKGAYGSGPINDLVRASLRREDESRLTFQLDVRAAIPTPLSAISGRPYYDLIFEGSSRRIEIRWVPSPGARWEAVVRELREGVWVDLRQLPLYIQGSRFTVPFKRADVAVSSPLRWFVWDGGETGIGNDTYFCAFDTLPNSGVVEQP